MEIPESLLEKIEMLFMKYGLKSITMDDVAKHLGISKKTLYEYVENKNDLVEKMFDWHIMREKDAVAKIVSETEGNAIEQLSRIFKHVSKHLSNMSPSALYDMSKYYPACFSKFENYKNDIVRGLIRKNTLDGITQGYYRADVNPDIISSFYIGVMESIVAKAELFMKGELSFFDMYREFIHYHIRGIASPKGIDYLEKQPLA